MAIISVTHTKGGVGKTTTAVMLAAAATDLGIPVTLVDADPQGSAVMWAQAADAAGDPWSWEVCTAPDAQELQQTCLDPRLAGRLVIIDTPPGKADVIQVAINLADLVVVPTAASPLDIARVWPTLETTSHRPTVVVFTQVDLRANLPEVARNTLDEAGVAVAHTRLVSREAIKHMYATTPRRYYGYDALLRELLATDLIGDYNHD